MSLSYTVTNFEESSLINIVENYNHHHAEIVLH